ncbi:hypothetical protein V1521DRAFT_72978 [Lipomyces starkeyi]
MAKYCSILQLLNLIALLMLALLCCPGIFFTDGTYSLNRGAQTTILCSQRQLHLVNDVLPYLLPSLKSLTTYDNYFTMDFVCTRICFKHFN